VFLRNGFAALTVALTWAVASYSATSSLVYNSSTGLVYSGYANEGQTNAVNTLPDFSKAGYKGGGVAIPFIPAAVTISNGPGDDTALIQNAIDAVSARPLGTNGFRGAVLLEAGEYTVSSTLTISTSGVVIRGAGSQENGGTKITYTATTKSNLFEADGGEIEPIEIGGTRVRISDAFVPVGAMSFTVANASGFAPGDRIMVQNTVNQQWIDDLLDMSGWDADDTLWTPGAYQLSFRRTITALNGNTITIDAPIVQTIEDQYGGGDIYKYSYSGELENIGFECLRLESTYASSTDENHGWIAILFENLNNGWIRQVTARYFGYGLVTIRSNSQQITVEDCAMLDHKSVITGGRRYSFNMNDSQHLLFQRCLAREGRHDFVSGSKTPGPNVFVDCRADDTHSDSGPHHRYATGQIYDNVMAGQINVQNRENSGSGHGWAGAQILFWNCAADSIICDAPNGAMNWCIGSTAAHKQGSWAPGEPDGLWDSHNMPVTPRSLYYSQLTERLGANALNNIILPQQKAGGIWTELHNWAGDGLFLDDLLIWADEKMVVLTNQPLAVRGIVRNLQMLDRGVSNSWSRVSGPGSVSFADNTALETTATFSLNGPYVLELSVNDGVSIVSNTVTVQVGDTIPPAAPVNLMAMAGDGSVSLNWADNSEPDLDSYSVYRSTSTGSYGPAALASNLTSSTYVDSSVSNGILYYYAVTAVDSDGNESAQSSEVFAVPADPTNRPPAFTSDPVVEANAALGTAYSGTIADDAGDPDSDPMFFSKISGPAWLSIAPNGELSGTPGTGDLGLNSFAVQVIAAGGSDTATLKITVDGIAVHTYSTAQDPNLPANMLDGDTSDDSRWSASGFTQWAIFDFGRNRDLEGVDVWTYKDRPYQYTLALSDNPSSNFTIVVDRSANTDATQPIRDTFPSANGRYAKLAVSGVSGNITTWVSITEIGFTFSVPAGYDSWASDHGVGAAANDDDADGMNNLYEYALDGNPTNALDQGTLPVFSRLGNGFIYLHPKRSDDTNITYTVETTTNLMSGSWTTEGYTVIGTNVTDGTLHFVTNEINNVGAEKFIRLKIER